MVRALPLVALLALAVPAHAQVRADWVHAHDGVGQQDNFGAMDFDGTRIAVTGASFGTAFPLREDVETIVYDLAGNVLWSARWSSAGNNDDESRDIRLDGSGGVYVTGRTATTVGFDFVYQRLLQRYDPAGNLLWSRQNGVPFNRGTSNRIALFPNGDLAVTGTENANLGDMLVERWDPNGNLVWSWTSDGGFLAWDSLISVAIGSTGDVFALGWIGTNPSSANMRDVTIVRLDGTTGAHVWTTSLGAGSGFGSALRLDGSDHAYVGASVGVPGNGDDALVAALDSGGAIQWLRTYDGGALGNDTVSGLVLDPFGRLYAGGSIRVADTTRDMAIWCLDLAGNLAWSASHYGPYPGDESGLAVGVDRFGNAILAGVQRGAGFDYDFALISWDSAGVAAWSYVDDGPGMRSQFANQVRIVGDSIAAAGTDESPGAPDLYTVLLTRFAIPYCLGDGSATACPCANASAPAEVAGCASSLGTGGRLDGTGNAQLSADTFVLTARGMPNSSALYFQGTTQVAGGLGAPFGDGLRCAGGSVARLGTQTNVAGASRYPESGDPSISVRASIAAPGTFRYQVWYRNAASFCTSSTFNLSNALSVTWSA